VKALELSILFLFLMEERIANLFWPNHILDTSKIKSGYIIGWNCHGFTACVAAIVNDIAIKVLENELSILASSRDPKHMFMNSMCGVPPAIIGTVIVDSKDTLLPHPLKTPVTPLEFDFQRDELLEETRILNEKKSTADLWMTISINRDSLPVIESIYCCGYKYKTNSAQIFIYNQPNPTLLQYLSLDPLSLDVQLKGKELPPLLARKMNKHLKNSISPPNVNFHLILHQINASYELEKYFQERFMKRSREDRRANPVDRDYANFSAKVISALSALYTGFHYLFKKVLVHPMLYFLLLCRLLAEMVLRILNFPLYNNIMLKNVFFTAQQLDLRLNQICSWPYQYSLYSKRDSRSTANTRLHYIQLYNSIWLVANDIIMGVYFGGLVFDFLPLLTNILHSFVQQYSITSFENTITWLMGWPAGLKLNPNLDEFLGELFLSLIRIWAFTLTSLIRQLPTIIYVLGCSGAFGFSFILSTLADIIKLFTLHITLFYMIAAKLYSWQLSIILSLFYLFQGKKWNVLRNRLDSNDYYLDQLLLGTILFTLVIFLFPTTAVYYMLFTIVRLLMLIHIESYIPYAC
jgi:hypothetical protein